MINSDHEDWLAVLSVLSWRIFRLFVHNIVRLGIHVTDYIEEGCSVQGHIDGVAG